MPEQIFVDYSGAPPILLPLSVAHCWRGFYLPAGADEPYPDLTLPDGAYKICDEYDFKNPKTDYDRACSLGSRPAVQKIAVGSDYGLVFSTELDSLTWWAEQRMLVNAWQLPDLSRLCNVEWSDELVWRAAESQYVLMNACDVLANPLKEPHFAVELSPVQYLIQWGAYGWKDDDPAMILFRFVPRS